MTPRGPKRLTDIAVRNFKPKATRYEVPDGGQRALYVVVQPSGRKSYAVRYRFHGLPRKLTLASGISLAAARKAASEAMFEVAQGRDPNEAAKATKQKAAALAADTLQAICEEYIAREGKRLRTVDQIAATLKRLVYPKLGSRLIHTIKRTEIIRLLDKVEDAHGARTADYALAVIRSIMNWHAKRSDDFRSPIVRGMSRVNAKETARTRTLTDDELRRVWHAANESSPFPALVRFLLLTAARRDEAASMTWNEVVGSDWTLPADRNKTKVDLVRPLSKQALAILNAQPRFDGCDFVFTTNGRKPISGFSKFKKHFNAACKVNSWLLHDLRRTARTLLSRAGISPDHAERCLGHVIPGVRGTYDRHAYHREKRIAFDALASLVEHIVDPTDNVRPLQRSAQ